MRLTLPFTHLDFILTSTRSSTLNELFDFDFFACADDGVKSRDDGVEVLRGEHGHDRLSDLCRNQKFGAFVDLHAIAATHG